MNFWSVYHLTLLRYHIMSGQAKSVKKIATGCKDIRIENSKRAVSSFSDKNFTFQVLVLTSLLVTKQIYYKR